MSMSSSGTKILIISEELLYCKLEIQNKITKQITSFKYLVVKITNNGSPINGNNYEYLDA